MLQFHRALHICAVVLFSYALRCEAGDVAFRKHVINADSEFMAAAVFDVNRDGKLDIACGGYWYESPTWKKHFLRNVEVINGRPDGYAHEILDVNGDGWPDIITVNWRSGSLRWIENPGPDLNKEQEWKSHVIDTPGPMETGRLVDILGDGTPCILPSTVPYWYELVRKPNPAGGFTPEWIRHELPHQVAGHGIGFGDINGDGRGDIVATNGWLEAPQDRRNGKWIWHPDFDLGDRASIPILVVDVDGDGLNDIVWTMAHDYGVYWLQQTRSADGKIKWIRHAIDTSWAGAHAPLWVDLDGDGTPELVVGRRYLAHEGADPGEFDPQAIYRYQFDRKTRTWRRQVISYNDGTCFGLDPVAVDLTGSGRLDLVFGGRHGLYWFENLGKGDSVRQHETHDPLWFPKYSDHLNLMVVKDESAQRPVKTAFDIGQRRAQTLAAAQAVMGTLPDSYRRVPLDEAVLGEARTDAYVRRKITFGSDPTSRVTAYLLIPNNVTTSAPAMICLHDDTPLGKDEPAGLAGRENMHFADELARKGYICLVPDYPSYGEDHYDLKANSSAFASGAMKAAWDNIRGIDLLETIPQVNRRRIGIIGHGLGGQNALLTAAFDYRISATVVSGGFTTFPCYKGGNLADWASTRMMPRIHDVYRDDPSKLPFDFAEIIATLVPRPVFLIEPADDPMMNVQGVREAVAGAAEVYKFRRVGGALKAAYPPGGRDFSPDERNAVYAWLGERLTGRASAPRILRNR